MATEYTIGELAKAAEVPTSTLRYYERRGLVQPDNRSQGNYRLYGPEALERVHFVRAAQATGFTLDDVATLLNLRVTANRPCEDVQVLMEERLADVKTRMAELRHVQRVLTSFLEKCRATNRQGRCAVIEELTTACCPAPTDLTRGKHQRRVARIANALDESGFESRFTPTESRLRIEVLELVGKGRPVTAKQVQQIAWRVGMAREAAASFISQVSERDGKGRVVGILGLSQKRHPHRFKVAGRVLFTWCAWDALFLPALLKKTAEVESVCPVTKDRVEITITPQKLKEVMPRQAVVTMIVPRLKRRGPPTVEDVWQRFCQYVQFFRSEHAASQWISGKKEELRILSVEEAHELGRRAFEYVSK